MHGLETYAKEQIETLIPKFDGLELRAAVNDSSYSVEFFVCIDGEKKQCYELVDEGIFDEDKLDQVLLAIANYIRSDPGYNKGCVNKVAFQI